MAKQKGRAMLLKIADGAGGFSAFAGLTGKSLSINNERIDATTPDPDTPEGAMWRETLDGTKSVSVSGDYTLVEDASEKRLVEVALSTAAEERFQVVIPGLGTFEGAYAVNAEFSGDDKVTGSMSLESTGPQTFTAA